MKKLLTIFTVLFLSIGLYAQEHQIDYQIIVWDPCSGSTITVAGDGITTGESFSIPPYTLPDNMSDWQQLYDALVGTTFGIDSGALNEDITIGVNIFQFNCDDPGYYFDPNVFMFIGVTVIGDSSGFHGLDEFYYFNEGKYARLTIPTSDAFNALLNFLNISLNDIGFAYYLQDVWVSGGLEFSVNADNIELRLSHFSKFGGGRGSVVDVQDEINKPKEFTLYQNYPNPFNPTTHIRYSVPEKSYVTLKVYDALGSEITTLVKGEKPEGIYEVEFNASKLSSGIYFYELRSNNNVITKKMILLK